MNLHRATTEIQAIPRYSSPFFMHSGHFFLSRHVFKRASYNSLGLPLPQLCIPLLWDPMCRKRSPLPLSFTSPIPPQGHSPGKHSVEGFENGHSLHLCKVHHLQMPFWILQPPCLAGIPTVLTAWEANVQETCNNSPGVIHQIRGRKGRASNQSLQMSSSKFIAPHHSTASGLLWTSNV